MEESFGQNGDPISPPVENVPATTRAASVVQASSVSSTDAFPHNPMDSITERTQSLVTRFADTCKAVGANYKGLCAHVVLTAKHDERIDQILDQQTAIFDGLTDGIDKGVRELKELMNENETIRRKRLNDAINFYKDFEKDLLLVE